MTTKNLTLAGCYYEPCGGHVFPGQGALFGYGRCERCAVVVKRVGRKWRMLSAKEWAHPRRLPPRLASADVWMAQGWGAAKKRCALTHGAKS